MMAQQQMHLAKKQLVVIPMLLIALATIAPKSAHAAADDTKAFGEDLSLFQRGHQMGKMPAGLGLIYPDVPGAAPTRALDLAKWISPDVSSVIDLMFLMLIGAMILRWRQNQITQKNQTTTQRKVANPRSKAVSRAEKEELEQKANKALELHAAVLKGDVAMCEQALAKAGVSVEQKDGWLCTPLHVAAHRGSVPVMEWLLTHGAKVNAREAWDQTPLHFAAQAGHTRACEILVGYGADLTATDAQERTALLLAGQGGHADASESLLNMGATLGNKSESQVPALLNNLILRRMFEDVCRGSNASEAPPKKQGNGRPGAGLGL